MKCNFIQLYKWSELAYLMLEGREPLRHSDALATHFLSNLPYKFSIKWTLKCLSNSPLKSVVGYNPSFEEHGTATTVHPKAVVSRSLNGHINLFAPRSQPSFAQQPRNSPAQCQWTHHLSMDIFSGGECCGSMHCHFCFIPPSRTVHPNILASRHTCGPGRLFSWCWRDGSHSVTHVPQQLTTQYLSNWPSKISLKQPWDASGIHRLRTSTSDYSNATAQLIAQRYCGLPQPWFKECGTTATVHPMAISTCSFHAHNHRLALQPRNLRNIDQIIWTQRFLHVLRRGVSIWFQLFHIFTFHFFILPSRTATIVCYESVSQQIGK